MVALLPIWVLAVEASKHREEKTTKSLRFGGDGQFKILQVADMHYADGKTTPCEDVLPYQVAGCSDLNTTAFVKRMIQAEKPDFIVFTGMYCFLSFTCSFFYFIFLLFNSLFCNCC